MLPDKLCKELDDLAAMAAIHNYQLNSMTLYNIHAAQSSQIKDQVELSEMEEYLAKKDIQIVSDGVEVDEEISNVDVSHSVRPFDPSKIDVAFQNTTMDSLIKRIKNSESELNTDFQRKAG